MKKKNYRYQFHCNCGNILNRDYVGHGSSLTCKKCGATGEVMKFGLEVRYLWNSVGGGDVAHKPNKS